MKKSNRTFLFSLSIAILALLHGCIPYVQVSTENLAPGYQEDFQPLCKSVYLVHSNDSLSELMLEIDAEGFLYVRDKPIDPFKASATVRVVLFDSYNDKQWTDSTGLNISFEKDTLSGSHLSYKIPLKILKGNSCIAYVSIRDNNKETKQTLLVEVDKSNNFGQQWFIPGHNISRIPAAFVSNTESEISFIYNGADKEKLKCLFYNDSFPVPSPPYALENIVNQKIDADSTIPLSFSPDGKTITAKVTGAGIYFMTADPELQEGFTVIGAGNGFPDVNSHDAMMNPIRYISTQKEFKKISDAENRVTAIESFWLKIGQQEDHTRNLIRKYYTRVMHANRLFTSFTEGWQTDRGMIYIVFGPPNIVYRSDKNESWIYGEENNFFSILFTFEKMDNKFSDNDYTLQRTPVFKDNWFRAVEIWRQ